MAREPKRRNAPKAISRTNSPQTSEETEVARLARELNDAREQQTAMSEVLEVISSSPGDLNPVFESVLENATRLCEAKFGNLFLRTEDGFRFVAVHGVPSTHIEWPNREPQLALSVHPNPSRRARSLCSPTLPPMQSLLSTTRLRERTDEVAKLNQQLEQRVVDQVSTTPGGWQIAALLI
jgi:hypothetical protein